MKNRALFLDRDGVINLDKGYLYHPKDVEWVPGIVELMQRFQNAGFLLIVVTNQSGIARGYYDKADFLHLMQWMKSEVATQGVSIDDVFFCPHHPEKGNAPYKTDCRCRKPKPGMLLDAIEKWQIDPVQSVFIGDSWRDMVAGEEANIGELVFCGDPAVGKQEQLKQPLDTAVRFQPSLFDISP